MVCLMDQFKFPLLPVLLCTPSQASAHQLEMRRFASAGKCYAVGLALPGFLDCATVLTLSCCVHVPLCSMLYAFFTTVVSCASYPINSLFPYIVASIALCDLWASTFVTKVRTCSLVNSLIFFILVNSLIILDVVGL